MQIIQRTPGSTGGDDVICKKRLQLLYLSHDYVPGKEEEEEEIKSLEFCHWERMIHKDKMKKHNNNPLPILPIISILSVTITPPNPSSCCFAVLITLALISHYSFFEFVLLILTSTRRGIGPSIILTDIQHRNISSVGLSDTVQRLELEGPYKALYCPLVL